MTDQHRHDTPPDPYHDSHRTDEKNRLLAERVEKIEPLLIEKGILTRPLWWYVKKIEEDFLQDGAVDFSMGQVVAVAATRCV